MAKYPVESSEVIDFTPYSLRNLPVPPVFKIRPGTWRDKLSVKTMIQKEGLKRHSLSAIRDEVINGLKAGWSEEAFAEYEGRLRAYWDAADCHEKQSEEISPDKQEDFTHPDGELVKEMTDSIIEYWPRVREILADNREFDAMYPMIVAAHALQGWSGVDAPFKRHSGNVDLGCIHALTEAIADLETENESVEGVIPGAATLELYGQCTGMVLLSGEERKNFLSLSMSRSSPNDLMMDGKEADPGTSAESVTSPQAPVT